MRIQNIRFPESDICSEEELYFHRRDGWIDFDGYFNLFYIEKRKKYTNLQTLKLHLEVKNCQAIRLMHDDKVIFEELITEKEKSLELEFPYNETEKGVFWFSIKTAIEPEITEPEISGYFEGTGLKLKPVRIAAVVCTFKREPYVLRNLKSVLKFLDKPENKSMKLCYWLIDNGQTLSEHEEISTLAAKYPDVIRIIPNMNVGGAGGFTRGMIEAIEKKEDLGLTHVQMMDDDAIIDPELFTRAYGFLAMRKDEWEDITLGGSLLREDFPYIQQAAGEYFKDFTVKNDFPLADLRDTKVCTDQYMCEAVHENVPYSGWWCCCMSLNVVRPDNLPIPLFIHHDDIEFGIRNQENGIVFLNGFGVWHKGFELTFTGVNTYYDIRNTLITMALAGKKIDDEKTETEILGWIWKHITADIIEYRYSEMRLAYQAFYDFCRGPEWLYKTDSEKLNNWLREQIKMKPIEELKDELGETEYKKIKDYADKYRDQYDVDSVKRYLGPERKKGAFIKKFTFNGWLLPADKKLIALSPIEPPFDAFRKEKIVLFEPFSGKAVLAKREWKELWLAFRLYRDALKLMKKHKLSAKRYREDIRKFTSMESWKKYLHIADYK